MKYEQDQWSVLLFVQGSSADRRDFSGTPEEDPVQRPNAPNPQRIPAILTLPRIPCFCSYGPVRPRPIDQSLWSVTEPANQRESLGLILLVWYGLMDFSRWSQDRLTLVKRVTSTGHTGRWNMTCHCCRALWEFNRIFTLKVQYNYYFYYNVRLFCNYFVRIKTAQIMNECLFSQSTVGAVNQTDCKPCDQSH